MMLSEEIGEKIEGCLEYRRPYLEAAKTLNMDKNVILR